MRLATICVLTAVSFIGRTAWLQRTISTALLLQIGPPTAVPIAHIHVHKATTPTMLTSPSTCDEEPRASGVVNVKCATVLQPLGSGGLHSYRPLGVPRHGSGHHDGSDIAIGTQRLWCIRLCTKAAGDSDRLASRVSLSFGCICTPNTQWGVQFRVGTVMSGGYCDGNGADSCTYRHCKDDSLCGDAFFCNNSLGRVSTCGTRSH